MTVGAGALRASAVGACAVLALAAGCGGDDDAAAPTTSAPITTTTLPERPTTTTSLVYDPATVEGQVEQAYLRSWDVYAAAVYDLVLDEEALASVYAEPHLSAVRDDIRERISSGRAARFGAEYSYEVHLVDDERAVVLDRQVNHQTLIDPLTKAPIEPDPNEPIDRAVLLQRLPMGWRVVRVDRAP
jgi:hypothetical protein